MNLVCGRIIEDITATYILGVKSILSVPGISSCPPFFLLNWKCCLPSISQLYYFSPQLVDIVIDLVAWV